MTPVQRSEAARQAILTATLELAGEVGYRKLNIEGIAARAGVGKQTIYRWWPSKGAVLFDAILALSEGSDGALPDTGDVAADLKLVLRATVDELVEPGYDRLLRALSIEIAGDPELSALYAERLDRPVHALKLARLRSAQAAGELAADADLEIAVELIWSPLAHRWLHRTGPLTHDFVDRIVDAALAGLRPRDDE